MVRKIDQPASTGGSGGSSGGGGRYATKPKPPVANRNALTQGRVPAAPPKPAAPARNTSRGSSGGGGSYGGGYYGGGGGGGGSYGAYSAPVQPAVPSEEDYLKGDATYQATISALANQLKLLNSDIDAQLAKQKLDYGNALQQLGYVAPSAEGAEGTWLWEDQTTAAGRAYQAMLNDFAARNMIQSQAYGDAQNDLTRTLNKQYEGLTTANTQTIDDLTRQRTKAQTENTAASQAARAEAILRRAAQYGFGV